MVLGQQEGLHSIMHERQLLRIQSSLTSEAIHSLNLFPEDPQMQRDSSAHYLEAEALQREGQKRNEVVRQLGNAVEEMLGQVGESLADQVYKSFPNLKTATHLFIPRSSWALAYGFTPDTTSLSATNQGALKQDGNILSLEQFTRLQDHVLVIDDILFQAKAVNKLLEELKRRGYPGKVTVVCAVVDPYRSRELIMSQKMVEMVIAASAPAHGIAPQTRS